MIFADSLLSQIISGRSSLIPVSGLSQEHLPSLVLGQIVQGEVLSSPLPRQFLVRIQGEIVQAQSLVPLPLRSEISLRVEALSPQIVLSLFPESAADGLWDRLSGLRDAVRSWHNYSSLWSSLTRSLSLFSKEETSHPVIQNLQDLLKSLPLQENGSLPLPEALKSSGLFYEATILKSAQDGILGPDSGVRDLKGALLRFLETPQAATPWREAVAGGKEMPSAGTAARQLLNLIELYQFSNTPRETGAHSLTVPLAFGSPANLTPAYLHLEIPARGKGRDESRPVSLLAYLQLTALGNLRIDGLVLGFQVKLSVTTESEAVSTLLRRWGGTLRERLLAAGFHLDELHCRVSPQKIQEARTEINPLHWLSKEGLLDVRI